MIAGRNAPTEKDLLLILQEALQEPIGLLLQVSDPKKAREKFYLARSNSGSAEMTRLQLRIVTHPEGNLLLVKGAPKA